MVGQGIEVCHDSDEQAVKKIAERFLPVAQYSGEPAFIHSSTGEKVAPPDCPAERGKKTLCDSLLFILMKQRGPVNQIIILFPPNFSLFFTAIPACAGMTWLCRTNNLKTVV
jgi:hypothetical protein